MKLVKVIALAALAVAPALSFAQSSSGVTRAQVVAELEQLEQAGFNPASDNTQYPAGIQAALARIHASGNTVASGASNAETPRAAANHASAQNDVTGVGSIYAHS
ncbi:DUF4148 domain-containing protein [Pandoraea anhela]|uniref:Purine nucleoside phosphorylase n=1 Tax=Pandoraea anhela TaxID=2508295 RepID=A0A5E4V3Y8_9BURK|nr:DUF4148 domain-containing protein [Pandoraea anhela]VVE06967.1 hypothetical protein PAN31108_02423 [Pandoraea anhela]